MRQIRETLRLHLSAGLGLREVGRSLKISRSVAGKYVSLARVAGVDWAIAQSFTDEELEARLYRPALARSSHQLAPDFALVHQELKRAGVRFASRPLERTCAGESGHMTVNLDYPPDATPLDAGELASLIPGHITTQAELNEWEQLNIVQGESWARKQRKEILNEGFLRQLHKQMFGETWKWAGEFRKSDKNIGVDWL